MGDGRVVLLVAKAEMGQVVLTALSRILAEELDVDWANVDVQQARVNPAQYDHLTVGSDSVRSLWLPLRRAGAQARDLLVRAAAARWGVLPNQCRTELGRILGPQRQQARYADVVADAAALPELDEVKLKQIAEFRLVGRPVPAIECASKVDGSAIYGIDVRLPGMMRAVVARCPRIGGRLRSFDSSAALAVSGVHSVFAIDPVGHDAFTRGGVAIVARDCWAAIEGRRGLKVNWEFRNDTDFSSPQISASLRRNTSMVGFVVQTRGHALAALAGRRGIIERTFELPFLAHATMEPMNATVHVQADRVEAWLPTQNAADARAAIAAILDRAQQTVIVHQTLVGGGFGRRDATDFAVEAAQVASRVGAPVQVFWTREDDFKFDRYRPAAVHTVSASLDAHGYPQAWCDRMSSVSIEAFLRLSPQSAPEETEVGGARDIPYKVPAFRMEYTALQSPVPVGWWRSVEDSINAFAVECFVDELAAATQKDPLQYRMGMLPARRNIPGRDGTVIETDRLRRVLTAVAEHAAWTSEAPARRGRGLACHCCRGSYIAIVAEVSLAAQNLPTVHRIWAAVDCGMAVNPLGLDAQISGGLQFGTSAALYEAVSLRSGGIEQNNFNDYRLLRMSESPVTEVRIIASSAAPSGAGEIAVPPVAPAIANAVFQLTGRRVRSLPIAHALMTS